MFTRHNTQKPVTGIQLNRRHPLNRGLVSYWLMNEGGGDTVSDISGNNLLGTFNAAGSYTWVGMGAPIRGAGLTFSVSANSRIETTKNPLSGEGTILFWLSWPWAIGDAHADRSVFSTAGGSHVDIIYLNDGTQYRHRFGAGEQDLTYSPSWAADSIHCLVSTIKSGDSRLYADGVLVNTEAAAAAMPTGGTWRFGGEPDTFDIGPEHTMMMFAAWDRILNPSEIARLYYEPFCLFQREMIEVWVGATSVGAPPVGNAGIMTTWGGFWGATY